MTRRRYDQRLILWGVTVVLTERTHEPDWEALTNYARRAAQGNGRWDWEDVAQDALLRIWRLWQAGELRHPQATLSCAVTTVAVDHSRYDCRCRNDRRVTTSLDALRRESDEGDRGVRLDHHNHARDGDFADAVALRLTLRPTLRRLPPAYRIVLWLRLQDQPYHEIAHALHVPVGTVKSRYSYALRRTRKLLGEMEVV